MEKVDFLYFWGRGPKGINLIMFRVTFSEKMRLKKIGAFWIITVQMLQNRGYSVLNGPISHRVAHKTWFLKTQINKKHTNFVGLYLHRMFIKYSKENTLSNFGGLNFLQIKSLFANEGCEVTEFVLTLHYRCQLGRRKLLRGQQEYKKHRKKEQNLRRRKRTRSRQRRKKNQHL